MTSMRRTTVVLNAAARYFGVNAAAAAPAWKQTAGPAAAAVQRAPIAGAMRGPASKMTLGRWMSSSVPDGYKYASSHEWVKLDGDVATVGVSDFAQSELGDVVYVEVPEVGTEFEKTGESFGVLESTKAASDVYTPVTGTVVEVNEELTDNPGLVNKEPFEGGWLMKIKLTGDSAKELDALLDAEAYKKHIA